MNALELLIRGIAIKTSAFLVWKKKSVGTDGSVRQRLCFLGSVERVRGFCMLRRSNINADDYTYKCMLIYIDRSTTTIMENGHKYLATKSYILSLYIRDLTVRLT